MRIVAGAWRGRTLIAPPGQETRPTADRVRQALFDMLMHAEWGGRALVEGAMVLDVFAGTGALGLEALSRGAAHACFIERDRAALRALRTNVATCKAEPQAEVLAVDVLSIGPASRSAKALTAVDAAKPWVSGPGPVMTRGGKSVLNAPADGAQPAGSCAGAPAGGGPDTPASLVFLDPPYGQHLVANAIARLRDVRRIGAGALIVAETGRDETWVPEQPLLAERQYGAARVLVFRAA